MEVASEELNESKEKDASFNFIDTLQFHYENLHSFIEVGEEIGISIKDDGKNKVENDKLFHSFIEKKLSNLFENSSQPLSFLFLGEKSAGKTENSIKLINYLIERSNEIIIKKGSIEPAFVSEHSLNIGKNLKLAIDLLESFSSTPPSSSSSSSPSFSSRFGKIIEIILDKKGIIMGANIKTESQIEKQRLIGGSHYSDQKNDQPHFNYLIFYQFLQSQLENPDKEIFYSSLLGKGISHFSYLSDHNNDNDNNKENCDQKENFPIIGKEKKNLFSLFERKKEENEKEEVNKEFPHIEISQIKKTIAIILQLGNINFTLNRDEEAEIDLSSLPLIHFISQQLNTNSDDLIRSLLYREYGNHRDYILIRNDIFYAKKARDLIAIILYESLFEEIVDGMNEIFIF